MMMKKIEISKELENLLDKANLLTNSCRNDITILEHMDKSSEDFEKRISSLEKKLSDLNELANLINDMVYKVKKQ